MFPSGIVSYQNLLLAHMPQYRVANWHDPRWKEGAHGDNLPQILIAILRTVDDAKRQAAIDAEIARERAEAERPQREEEEGDRSRSYDGRRSSRVSMRCSPRRHDGLVAVN